MTDLVAALGATATDALLAGQFTFEPA